MGQNDMFTHPALLTYPLFTLHPFSVWKFEPYLQMIDSIVNKLTSFDGNAVSITIPKP